MSKKIIYDDEDGPMVSEIPWPSTKTCMENDIEEDNTYEFQDRVLVCLRELELLADRANTSVTLITASIKDLRAYIHGEEPK